MFVIFALLNHLIPTSVLSHRLFETFALCNLLTDNFTLTTNFSLSSHLTAIVVFLTFKPPDSHFCIADLFDHKFCSMDPPYYHYRFVRLIEPSA